MAEEQRLQTGDTAKGGPARKEFTEEQLNRQQEMFDGFGQLRSLIDSIPTPGADEGDALGGFSLFSLSKDILDGALNLIEAPVVGRLEPEYIMENALKMGAGQAGMSAALNPAGSLGMFGARPSRHAPVSVHSEFRNRELRAQELERKAQDPKWREDHNIGSDRDLYKDIWNDTGLSKDHSGRWRYEVVDEDATVDYKNLNNLNFRDVGEYTKLDEILDSKKVFKHWPELRDVRVESKDLGTSLGAYNREDNVMYLNVDMLNMMGPDEILGTVLHETQHALQYAQNRKGGTNPQRSFDQMTRAMDAVNGSVKSLRSNPNLNNRQRYAIQKFEDMQLMWNILKQFYDDHAAYAADPGEIEARLTERATKDKNTFPDDRRGGTIPPPEARMTPDDVYDVARELLPDRQPVEAKEGKTFGKRGKE